MSQSFDFERLVELCRHTHDETRRSAARAVDRSLVVRNWLFGWYIVEYEQRGADRAEYGAQTLKKLSAALKARIGRGFSLRSLELFRRFYLQSEETLPQAGKAQTLSAISAAAQNPQTSSAKSTVSAEGLSQVLRSASTTLLQHLTLGWSHYVTLLSVTDPEARRFYEIEAADNGWSVRELKRQLGSSLYERLALSRDKHEVRRLAREGQVVEKASGPDQGPSGAGVPRPWRRIRPTPKAIWKPRSSTGSSSSCSSSARDSCSRHGRSGSASTTVTSSWTWCFTTGCFAAMC